MQMMISLPMARSPAGNRGPSGRNSKEIIWLSYDIINTGTFLFPFGNAVPRLEWEKKRDCCKYKYQYSMLNGNRGG